MRSLKKVYRDYLMKIKAKELASEEKRKVEFAAIIDRNVKERMAKEVNELEISGLLNPDMHIFAIFLPLKVTVDKDSHLHMSLKLTEFMSYDFLDKNQSEVSKEIALEYIRSELADSLKARVYEQVSRKKQHEKP